MGQAEGVYGCMQVIDYYDEDPTAMDRALRVRHLQTSISSHLLSHARGHSCEQLLALLYICDYNDQLD